ncbi:MAG TPA: glycoside hydrolase family 31 protein [Actinomycetales bacterium]|nr:glycoside hydrolase family 31 protein [Actinomycetales bacterium]
MTSTLDEPGMVWTVQTTSDQLDVRLERGECWWGGAVADGRQMPFGDRPHARDLARTAGAAHDALTGANQSAPLLLSSTGRVVWSERPFAYAFDDGRLRVTGRDVVLGRGGASLSEGFRAASSRFFPASGRAPSRELFTGPQYNTWIQMPYSPTQEGVLAYTRQLLDDGMPAGVVMIDDCWSPDYGTWHFDPARFPDPGAMVERLHTWGCSLMLWVVPFVSPDSATFRRLEGRGLLLRDRNGETAVRRWWNGYSALLDVTNPQTVEWFWGELDALVAETGVDGFKFDAGDLRDYRPDDRTAAGVEPVDLCEAWARLGLRYPFNEYRACWKMGGQPLAQRLHDKPPAWGPEGIESLIPELIAQGLIGHPFTCADMIGGGELGAVSRAGAVDQEFFVRYAQVAALAPMMQFSLSPARVLDDHHRAAVARAVQIRQDLMPLLLDLVDHAARTGEPILRPMAYHAAGTEAVTNQFFLGPDLVVAPVLHRGATTREVQLPGGTWQSDDGSLVHGPTTITVTTRLDRIPRFRRRPTH